MVDYDFYMGKYMGSEIPNDDFTRLLHRANDQLAKYKRSYTVTAPDENSEDMAVCAMVEAMYCIELVANGGAVQSASIGSVSTSYGSIQAVDVSPAGQSKAVWDAANMYLDIYRGVG